MTRFPAIALACALLACSNGVRTGKASRPPATPTPQPAPQKATPSQPQVPVTYRLAFDVSLEHGCSQSHESRGTDGSLVLEVNEKNEATLTVHAQYTSVFGPSFSKFQQGYDDFSTIFNTEHSVWTGTAERTENRINVTFHTIESASIKWMDYGNPDLPLATTSAASLGLSCKIAPTEVYAPLEEGTYFWETDDETPEQKAVLLCKPSGPLFEGWEDMILVDDAVPLLDGAGLALESSTMFWNTSLTIRLVH